MNIREIFDKVWKRLNDGKGCATSATGGYSYCNDYGNRCAVGIFLPDNEEMLGFGGMVYNLVDEFKDHPDFPPFIKRNLLLMSELQSLHDNPKHWNGKEFNSTGKTLFKKLKDGYFGKED